MNEKEPKEKVHLNDIKEEMQDRPTKIFIVGDKKYWADRISKNSLATHADCERCDKEFEKKFTHSRYCSDCEYVINNEKYNALELVEWNGKDVVAIWGDDTYFFDMDDIETYCEEHEIDSSQLKLVLCKETSFGSINLFEHFQDDLHEDWEPDAEFERIHKELDRYLATASTNTWTATNKRVSIGN